jgi:hypothetical protein
MFPAPQASCLEILTANNRGEARNYHPQLKVEHREHTVCGNKFQNLEIKKADATGPHM